MSGEAEAFRKKAVNAKTENDRRYFEQKAADIEDRSAATSDAVRVERVLEETEAIFDELEQQLQRMKPSNVFNNTLVYVLRFHVADAFVLNKLAVETVLQF